MSLEQTLHKKMVKMVLGGVAKLEDDEMEQSILESAKASAKPKIRGIKEFFLSGIREMRRDLKKTHRKK